MSHALYLLAALILDAIFGEPERIWSRVPHPVKVAGVAIEQADKRLNRGSNRRLKGALAVAGLMAASLVIGLLLAAVPDGGLLEILGAAILLSHKSLMDHVKAVADGLRVNLSEGRREVAKIVGRDVGQMEQSDVARATLESAAENFSDGVLAPSFWFLLFGLPGILVYKAVNTADSMIGHRNERHGDFGMAAAKVDDVLNWIPARLACALIALTNGVWKSFGPMRRDASRHRSPNAGWPEAALARVLDVSLSGPRKYGGLETSDPYVNDGGRRDLSAGDIFDGIAALRKSWIGLCAICVVLALLIQ